jgi:hypothetical protein
MTQNISSTSKRRNPHFLPEQVLFHPHLTQLKVRAQHPRGSNIPALENIASRTPQVPLHQPLRRVPTPTSQRDLMPPPRERALVYPYHTDSRISCTAFSPMIKRVRCTFYNKWDPPRVARLLSPTSPLFSSTKEAAPINVDVLEPLAAAFAVRTRQVAEFTTAAGYEAHAAAIAAGATEEEAAHAA